MKNITKDQLVNILKSPDLDFQLKHFYLHEYIKHHEKSSFGEGIIEFSSQNRSDQRDVYYLKLPKDNITYLFMTKMNISHDGYLLFSTTIQNYVHLKHQTYLECINNEFISLIEELL